MVDLHKMGAGAAPTEADLNQLARILSDKPTTLGWVCPLCRHTNSPVDNLLVKLPSFKCSNPNNSCNGKCPGTPEWSISDCIINKVRTDFLISDQGSHPTCAGHALVGGMYASLRIQGALRCKSLSQPLNIVDLFVKYHIKLGVYLGNEGNHEAVVSRIPYLLGIAESQGVEYIALDGSRKTGRVLKLKSWFSMRTKNNTNFLIRLIASGFPLLSSMRTGRCFQMANDGQLYRAPELTVNHAILLIGCTVRQVWLPAEGDDGTTELVEKVIFKARDSKGDRRHVSADYAGTGGDIYLLAEDLGSHVFGFHLELPDWMG